jgi:hypothetical protein
MLTAKGGGIYLDQSNYTENIKYYYMAILIDPNIETYWNNSSLFIGSLKISDTIIRVTLCLFQILVFNSGVINNE